MSAAASRLRWSTLFGQTAKAKGKHENFKNFDGPAP
jgi:hypothetical protein